MCRYADCIFQFNNIFMEGSIWRNTSNVNFLLLKQNWSRILIFLEICLRKIKFLNIRLFRKRFFIKRYIRLGVLYHILQSTSASQPSNQVHGIYSLFSSLSKKVFISLPVGSTGLKNEIFGYPNDSIHWGTKKIFFAQQIL